MNCRFCGEPLTHELIDLGMAPPSNAYVHKDDLRKPGPHYPLKVLVCSHCWLVQTEEDTPAEELFRPDYAYFSSTSKSWLHHAAQYSAMICDRLGLDGKSFVIEIASNDGYLLRNFVSRNIPCLGIEPTDSTADAAEQIGIPVLRRFFNTAVARQLGKEGKQADLIIGNNVYAHVPDIRDFTEGMKAALKSGGTITLEFPHLMRLIEKRQFDTIYHEHYSYLSFHTVHRIFTAFGLRIFDVEELPTHGGSLRIYACHEEDKRPRTVTVSRVLAEEDKRGLQNLSTYAAFQQEADRVKNSLLHFLRTQIEAGRKVAAYGAAAKGNTLLNYAGVKPNLIPYVCDAASSKQGKFMPGSLIPILSPAALREDRPDVILILPWNIAEEIVQEHAYVREWNAVFVVALPEIRILDPGATGGEAKG